MEIPPEHVPENVPDIDVDVALVTCHWKLPQEPGDGSDTSADAQVPASGEPGAGAAGAGAVGAGAAGAGAAGAGAAVETVFSGDAGARTFVLLSTAHAVANVEAAARLASRIRILFICVCGCGRTPLPITSLSRRVRNCTHRAGGLIEFRVFQRLGAQRVQKAGQVIVKGILRAAEGEIVPWNVGGVELGRFQTLLVDAERAPDRRGGVDDDDRRATGVRVDVDQAVEPHLEAAFLPRLPHGRNRQRLPAIDVAARKDPSSVARLDRAADQHEPAVALSDDGADGDFGVQVEDEPAPRADRTLGFRGLQLPPFERSTTARAEPVRRGFIMRVEWAGHGRCPV
jgi:hypothetical protein